MLKKTKLWRLIRVTLYLLLASVVAILVTALFLFTLVLSGSDDDVVDNQTLKNSLGSEAQDLQMSRGEMRLFEQKRNDLALMINPEIKWFYKQKGFYPNSLNDLPIAKTDEFTQYRSGINYSSGMKNKKPFYKLNWLSSSPWNGMQCTAGIKPEDPSGYELSGEQAKPVNGNCYVLDYH